MSRIGIYLITFLSLLIYIQGFSQVLPGSLIFGRRLVNIRRSQVILKVKKNKKGPAPKIAPVHKAKEGAIEVTGIVVESLPNTLFRVKIQPSNDEVLAVLNGRMRKCFIKVLVGDKVEVELSPYDLTRGRIAFRHR